MSYKGLLFDLQKNSCVESEKKIFKQAFQKTTNIQFTRYSFSKLGKLNLGRMVIVLAVLIKSVQ